MKRALTVWLEKMTIKIFEYEEFQQRIIMLDLEEQILFSDVFYVTFRRKKALNGALLVKIFEALLLNQKIVWNNCVFIEYFYLMLRNGHEISQLSAKSKGLVNLYNALLKFGKKKQKNQFPIFLTLKEQRRGFQETSEE